MLDSAGAVCQQHLPTYFMSTLEHSDIMAGRRTISMFKFAMPEGIGKGVGNAHDEEMMVNVKVPQTEENDVAIVDRE